MAPHSLFKEAKLDGKIGLLFEIRHNLYYLHQGLRVMRFYFSVCPVPVAELKIISVRWCK